MRVFGRVAGTILLAGLTPNASPVAQAQAPPVPELRQALFGDLHLHTALSLDSNAVFQNTQVTPDVAYRFAQGLPVTVAGRMIQREWPLDFLAISDHAENLGTGPEARKLGGRLAHTPLAQGLPHAGSPDERLRLVRGLPQRQMDPRVLTAAWVQVVASANRSYRPGRFTTFIAYEWTAHETYAREVVGPTHRGVVFSGGTAPEPFSRFESKDPEDLWAYLGRAREKHGDALAIVNHPTDSQGQAFSLTRNGGRPIDCAYLRTRRENEPLTEIAQSHFQHESQSAISPADVWLDDASNSKPPLYGGTVRDALGRGLNEYRLRGVNPFELGVVGTSDNHVGLSLSPNDLARLKQARHPLLNAAPTGLDIAASALTGVWADGNSRPAIFAALRRREVFATTGVRIKVRFFGGWSYDASILADSEWLGRAYAEGAPMGGTMPPRGAAGGAPSFILWAVPAHEGAPLGRIQVVKLAASEGGYSERVFEVANFDRALRSKGAPYLALWRDPEFNPDAPAAYYLRVLEQPADGRRSTQRHRAWSSPIWYRPLETAKGTECPQ